MHLGTSTQSKREQNGRCTARSGRSLEKIKPIFAYNLQLPLSALIARLIFNQRRGFGVAVSNDVCVFRLFKNSRLF
jgi:hypothetical protein